MYQDRLSVIGAEADAQIAQLNKDYAALEAELVAAGNHIRELEAALVELQPVKPILVGSSTGGANAPADFEAFATRCGGLESIRAFLPPGSMPTTLAKTSAASSVGKRHIVLSAKGRFDNINEACQSVIRGADSVWLIPLLTELAKNPQGGAFIWRHEPDEESPDIFLWHAANKIIRSLVDTINIAQNTKLKFGACFMEWSSSKVPARIKDFYPGDGVWDFISWDGYAESAPWKSGEAIFKSCIAWNKAHGDLPFAIGEFGATGSITSDRSAFIKSVYDYAHANNALWIHYWNASTAKGNYVLSPSDEKVLGSL